jgi:RNA-binding protein with serine-rich domain 1
LTGDIAPTSNVISLPSIIPLFYISRQRSRSRSFSPDSSDFGNSPVKATGKFRSPSPSPGTNGGRSPVKPVGYYLAISHLTRNVNDAHLREIFGVYGEIVAVSYPMHPNTGYPIGRAVIEFSSSEALNSAITGMNGGQIDGNVIECSVSQYSSPNLPHKHPRSVARERRPAKRGKEFNNRPRRTDHYAPGRRYRSPSRSPIRRRSFSRSRSPIRRRDSRSPPHRRGRSRSITRHRNASRSRSPMRRRSPYVSRSPPRRIRSISRSPPRRFSRTPPRRLSRSPPRRLSRSPPRRISRSPPRRFSRSPPRRFSRSPPRRMRSISRSPPNGRFRQRFDKPKRPLSRSPSPRRFSPSRRSPSRSPVPVSRMNY